MKKKIVMGIISILIISTITGCSNKASNDQNTTDTNETKAEKAIEKEQKSESELVKENVDSFVKKNNIEKYEVVEEDNYITFRVTITKEAFEEILCNGDAEKKWNDFIAKYEEENKAQRKELDKAGYIETSYQTCIIQEGNDAGEESYIIVDGVVKRDAIQDIKDYYGVEDIDEFYSGANS